MPMAAPYGVRVEYSSDTSATRIGCASSEVALRRRAFRRRIPFDPTSTVWREGAATAGAQVGGEPVVGLGGIDAPGVQDGATAIEEAALNAAPDRNLAGSARLTAQAKR